jgi:hypothetical protein
MISKNDLMPASELIALLGRGKKTLARYRQNHWQEGIHYLTVVQGIVYVRPMIMDWILNYEKRPMAHQDAMWEWLVKTQTTNPTAHKNLVEAWTARMTAWEAQQLKAKARKKTS